MIVVEDGRDYIGQQIETTVTSVLQTPAGKMIFVRKELKIKNPIFMGFFCFMFNY